MKIFLFNIFCVIAFFSDAQNPLFIPDTLAGPNYSLTMHTDSVQFFPGKKSYTYAYNLNKYLGPTLIFRKGTAVNITVNNQLNDTTTVHWHGIHLPSKWDGGPHSPILPNATWNPQFTIMDNAATYWYHPHMHMKTAVQAIKGATGLIIVRDNVEAALTLPRRYGIDDFPLIVQSQQYDSLNQSMPRGMEDSTLLVNGTMTPFLNAPAQVVRMRILNASGERTFNFGFSDNKQFYQIASDGGLLNLPNVTTRIRLSPGERAEILVNLSGMNTQTLNLMCYGSELPIGVQGGPTMPMPPGSPPMSSPLNGVDYSIMKINVVAPTLNPITTVPSILTANTVYLQSQSNASRKIRFTADSAMVMDGPFYFNDSTFNMMRIDYTIPLNSTEIWTLVNKTMVAHPFHIHDVQFQILNRNGISPGPEEKGRKDVVLVLPDDSISFIAKFEDYADDQIPFMYHCHILMHEDDGMMGQFVVGTSAVGIRSYTKNINELLIYPNPASDKLNVVIKNFNNHSNASLKIYNMLGNIVYSQNRVEGNLTQISTTGFAMGVYTIEFKCNTQVLTQKLIIE
ncbi:bilirubin oxidase [Sphingobacteriaceae bacterium]|nr:bilirubin oxidase [Sphingobacteriaceae bacterium]